MTADHTASLFTAIEPLLRAVVPAAVLCLQQPETPESRAAAAAAIRDAAAWFLPGVDTSKLAGHELDHRVVGQIVQHYMPGIEALPRHRTDVALSALTMLAEDLYSAHSRSVHSSGWIRPKLIGTKEAGQRLRGNIQQLVSFAVFAIEGDAKGMCRGQGRVAGRELDLDALLAVLAEDLGRAR